MSEARQEGFGGYCATELHSCYVHHCVLPSISEAQHEGQSAVIRTSLCTSHCHQSISEAQTAQSRRVREGAVLRISLCTIVNFNHQRGVAGSATREPREAGGVLCYV
jgi:hypothetical protein